jgi:hypothetical protein
MVVPTQHPHSSRLGSALRAAAGPTLIVASVLVVLRAIAFGGLVTFQNIDILPYFLPTYCFLGKTLASGHIPVWNPDVMGGVRFAADPQSGWGYLPAMLLFAVFGCDRAIRWFIVVQPILAGLGVYWFLRSEGASRAASTTGGLVLAMILCNSYFGIYLPFAGVIASTAVMLAAASRFVYAQATGKRILWGTATALGWGQAVSAYLVHGVIIGTGALMAYLVADAFVSRDFRSLRRSIIQGALLAAALPLVNAAVLLPRLVYLPTTSLAQGYGVLEGQVGFARWLGWPLELAVTPGPYAGAIALALSFAAWPVKRFRTVIIGVGGFGAVFYLLSVDRVVHGLAPTLQSSFVGQLLLHEPFRFEYATILALAIFVGLGVDAWGTAARWSERVRMLAPGIVVWGVLPPLFIWWRADPARGVIAPAVLAFAIGVALGAVILWLATRRRALLTLIPVVLALDLIAAGFIGQGMQVQPFSRAWYWSPLLKPTVDAGAYTRPSPIADTIRSEGDGRYLSYDKDRVTFFGYLLPQTPDSWGLLANQRAILFGIEDAGGYNAAQLQRYWTFVHTVDLKDAIYNSAFLYSPPPVALDLLQVRYVVTPTGAPPSWLSVATFDPDTLAWTFPAARDGPRALPVQADEGWLLLRLVDAAPRVSVVGEWALATTSAEALNTVTESGFDPKRQAVIEGIDLPLGQAAAPIGSASYEAMGTSSATITVDAPVRAAVVIRNAYDPYWHATLDGSPVPLYPGDYIDQALLVPPGHHTIQLRYNDPTVRVGLACSLLVVLGLLSAGALSLTAERRRRAAEQRPSLV